MLDEIVKKEIIISMHGDKAEGSIKINLDNYNSKLIDMLYIPQIKKILNEIIAEELKDNK